MLHDKRSTHRRRQRLEAIYAAAALSCVLFGSTSAWAQPRRWDGDVSGSWNNITNWEEIGLPTAGAIFGAEGNDQDQVTVSGFNAVTSFIDFEATATDYTITTSGVRLTVDGAAGITNNSTLQQNFVNSGANSQLRLRNSATISGGVNGVQITNDTGGLTLFIEDSGAGDATILNNAGGTTRFEDDASAENANITNDGVGAVTRFIENSRGETATITNQNSGETVFEDTSGANGTNITNNNGGTTRFTENSFATDNARIINNTGGLTVFEGDSTVDDATLINQNGGGVIRFEGAANGSSNTTVQNGSGGQLDISGAADPLTPVEIGSVSGAGDIFLGGNALRVGTQNTNDTISGVIQNGGFSGGVDGVLIKDGTETLRLTNDNTHTGATVIEEGTLQIDGSVSSDTFIQSGGILTGTGGGFEIVGNLTNTEGRIAPGRFGSNAIGSESRYGDLDVDGSVDINGDASRLDVRVNGDNSSFGNVNQLDVSGDVDLDGQVTVNAEDPATGGEYLVNNRYTIIDADGELTGTLDAGVNGNSIDPVESNIDDPAFFFLDANVIADYDADEVYLDLTRNTLDDQVDGVDLTPNQQALFDAYNDAIEAGAVISQGEENLINDFIINGEGQLSLANGDALTAFPLVAQGAASRFNQRIMSQAVQTQAEQAAEAADDDVIARRGSRLVYGGKRNLFAQAVEGEASSAAATGYTRRSNIWATIGRAKDEGNADGNGPGFDAKATEYQLGFNRSLSERTVVGLSIGKSDADVDIDERAAEGDVDTTSIGAFLRHDSNDWYWSGLLSYSRHSIDSERFNGIGDVTADFDARTLSLAGEVGKKMVRGGWNIEPNISLKFSNTKQDSFDESGLGALSVDSSSYNSRRLGLGVRVTNNDEDARIRPRLSLGFERELGDDNVRLSNSLPFLGTFDVDGTELGKNIFSARLGADARLNDRFSLTGEIGGSWRSNQDSHYLYGGVKYGW